MHIVLHVTAGLWNSAVILRVSELHTGVFVLERAAAAAAIKLK